ncbi:hypothetical protein [Microcoleus phage My-WqHQDG]|nr:hypothetical protein [Microcoleus phage My-WqHQDG]
MTRKALRTTPVHNDYVVETTTITKTYQLFIAPSDAVVETHDDPAYEAKVLDVDGIDPCLVITVQATSEATIVVPEGYRLLEVLEVIPQNFSVGDTVYMHWLYRPQLDGNCLLVSSIAGWDKEVGNIGWSEPQRIEGTKKYRVTLPDGLYTYPNGCLGWEQSATVQVIEVLS